MKGKQKSINCQMAGRRFSNLIFPHYKQPDAMDCGPTCLRIVSKHYGKNYTLQNLREKSRITREGVSLAGISDAAESIGFRTLGVKINFSQLKTEAVLPAIVHWNQNHFVVVYKISKKSEVYVSDPAKGLIKYTKNEFLENWIGINNNDFDAGIALLLETTSDFYKQEDEKQDKVGFGFLFSYVKPQKKLIVQLIIGLITGSLLQLIFPFLTQSIVDFGIGNQNIGFIYLVLAAQLMLYTGRTAVDFIRSWILLHISTRINISLISDFLLKLMKLPISFFDTKMTGDILQRIGDQSRIENFLTNTGLNIIFSLINLIIFGAVLAWYNLTIFTVFFIGTIFYTFWLLFFMKKRREIDYKRFAVMSQNQSNVIQLINGMQEIKLHNSERQ